MTNPERREKILNDLYSKAIFHLNNQFQKDDVKSALLSLEALMPEVMSEEDIIEVLGSPKYAHYNLTPVIKKSIAKALTIAKPQVEIPDGRQFECHKPQVMDLDKILTERPSCGLNCGHKECRDNFFYNLAVNDCRKALANMPKLMSVEEVEKVLPQRKEVKSIYGYDPNDIPQYRSGFDDGYNQAIEDLASKLIGKE